MDAVRKVLDKGFVVLHAYMGNDHTIVDAARVSFLGQSRDDVNDKKLLKYLIDNKHLSPFEHVTFQFVVKCPLFVRSQWMRHRTWSYNEVSRRYTSEEIEFYIPDTLRKQSVDNKQGSSTEYVDWPTSFVRGYFLDVTKHLKNEYDTLIKAGVAREQARMILPQSLYTTFYATVDLRNLLHFLELRLDPHAQWEIRQYAIAIKELISPIVPWTLEHWKE